MPIRSRDKTVWVWEAAPGDEYEVVDVKHGHSQVRLVPAAAAPVGLVRPPHTLAAHASRLHD